jgi:hypothetical protein
VANGSDRLSAVTPDLAESFLYAGQSSAQTFIVSMTAAKHPAATVRKNVWFIVISLQIELRSKSLDARLPTCKDP